MTKEDFHFYMVIALFFSLFILSASILCDLGVLQFMRLRKHLKVISEIIAIVSYKTDESVENVANEYSFFIKDILKLNNLDKPENFTYWSSFVIKVAKNRIEAFKKENIDKTKLSVTIIGKTYK